MNIGVTGSRTGWRIAQARTTVGILTAMSIYEFQCGDCVGSDENFYKFLTEVRGAKAIGHPPDDDKYRANLSYFYTHPTTPYGARDERIVLDSEGLIATPDTFVPKPHSGTWLTIRFALKHRRPIWIVFPDGSARYTDQKGKEYESFEGYVMR